MSACLTATNGAAQVRKLQRALSRPSTQDKKKRFDSLYDKVWRADVLWEAWRQVTANQGAPGVDGMAIETLSNTGQEEERITQLQKALREPRPQCAPVRVVEIPKPKGGTRPLGIATVEDRVVQTALRLVVEPIFAADLHDGSYGDRPKRAAQQASIAMREDR
jgi:RNA-directed DNA polymerase